MKIRNRSVVFIWSIAYLAVFLLPMCINLFSYVRLEKQLVEEVRSYNISLNTNKSQHLDRMLDEVYKVAYEVSMNTRVHDVIRYNVSNFLPEENFEIYKLSRELQTYKNAYSHIKDVYVYFANLDTVVSSSGYNDVSNFISRTYTAFDVEAYNEFMSRLTQRYTGKFVEISDNVESDTIAYIMSVADIGMKDILANVVVEIDESILTEYVISKDENKISGFIMKEKGRIITEKYNKDINSIKEKLEAVSKEELLSVYYHGNKYIVSEMQSEKSGIEYIYIMDENVFRGKIRKAQFMYVISFLLCLGVGMVFIMYLIKRNYQPINMILKIISTFSGGKYHGGNEFDYIKSIVLKIEKEKREYSNKLSVQEDIIADSVIEGLLKGRSFDRSSVDEILFAAGLSFVKPSFAVIIFFIDDVNYIFYEDSKTNKDDFKLAKIVINNIIGEMLTNAGISNIMCETDDFLCCVLNIDEYDRKIEAEIEKGREYIKEQFNIEFTVVISDVHKGCLQIADAYTEVIHTLEQRFVMWNKPIIKYSEIVDARQDVYYYPLELEQQLRTCVKAGESKAACSIIEELFRINFEERRITMQIAKCLMIGITDTIIKVAVNSVDTNGGFSLPIDNVNDIMAGKSVIKMKEKLIVFCKDICERCGRNTYMPLQKISDRITAFIEENYSDPDLNVMSIAEKFDMNANYMSGVFKQQNGKSILEYIAKVRIEKTKEIMQKQDISNEELCKMVGYTNVRTFSRVFTKYVGISPGKYKESLRR
ncbi:MAG: helix-turn-helix transcriptional regulator [Clostridia bacterium]|nr:helix-turn-helix transcriptional regulator [Clostridia bacterium]